MKALQLIIALLISEIRYLCYGKYSSEWIEWNQSVHSVYMQGEAVFEHSAEEQLRTMCLKRHHGRVDAAKDCVQMSMASMRSQRGKENGIFFSMKVVDGCQEAVIYSATGQVVVVYFDSYDDPRDVAHEVGLFLHSPMEGEPLEKLASLMHSKIANTPTEYRWRICPAAQTRRKAAQWESAVFSVEERSESTAQSSFRCTYPFERREWLLPEINALLPLGSCLYENLYLHNSVWYFVSDSLSEEDLPFTRLNTRTVENRGLKYELRPKVLSNAELKSLMQSTRGSESMNVKIFRGLTALLHRLTHANHGHALFDAVLPIMWAAKKSNVSLSNQDILVALVDLELPDVVDDRLRIVSPHRAPVYRREQLLGFLCRPGMWCRHDNVLAGVGGFGIEYYPTQSKERYELYADFRIQAAHVLGYEHLDINRDFVHSSILSEDNMLVNRVLIVQRYGNRAFEPAVVLYMKSALEATFPGVEVVIKYFENASVEEQAELMQHISLMVVVDGTALDNALFMPPCTGVVVVGRDVLNSEQYILNDGFEMHDDHINLWRQWLVIEKIESLPGSWASARGRGPLGGLAWNEDDRTRFAEAIWHVTRSRDACAAAKRINFGEFNKDGGIGGSADNSLSAAPVPRSSLTCERFLVPSDVELPSDVVLRVELENSSDWYQINDFWLFSISTSVPFLHDLHLILQPHLPRLFNDNNIFVINSGDGFIPILAFFNRCKSLEALETRVPSNANRMLGLFEKLFDNTKIFFQHLLPVDIYNDPARLFSRNDIDTLIVLGGSIDDVMSCGHDACDPDSFVSTLASRTHSYLVLEYIPQSCVCLTVSGGCKVTDRNELDNMEEALRKHFLSFHVAGFIETTCSFVYVAFSPVCNVKKAISASSVQGIILQPENNSKVVIRNGMTTTLLINVVVSAAEYPMKNMDRTVASEHVEINTLFDYFSPRLFIDGLHGTVLSGCSKNSDTFCFGNFTMHSLGNLRYLSYEIDISEVDTYDITFQILRNSRRIYKAHYTPELICQHTITVHAVDQKG